MLGYFSLQMTLQVGQVHTWQIQESTQHSEGPKPVEKDDASGREPDRPQQKMDVYTPSNVQKKNMKYHQHLSP